MAEVEAIAHVVREVERLAAAGTRAHVHVVHLSAADALPLVEAAHAAGLDVTAETCPHYLALVAEEIEDGATLCKCAPPIRSAANRERLWRGLAAGTIASIASDHSPSPHPFRSPGGAGFARLPTIPGGFYAEEGDAYGVNEKGQIVGSLWLGDTDEVLGERAVRWIDGQPEDLNTLVSPADQAAFVMAEAFDINERSQIVGWGVELPFEQFTYHERAFLLTPRCGS